MVFFLIVIVIYFIGNKYVFRILKDGLDYKWFLVFVMLKILEMWNVVKIWYNYYIVVKKYFGWGVDYMV